MGLFDPEIVLIEDYLFSFLVAKSEFFCMNMYIHIYKNVYPHRKHQNISILGYLIISPKWDPSMTLNRDCVVSKLVLFSDIGVVWG